MKRINYAGKFTSLFILTGLFFSSVMLFVLFIELKSFIYEVNKEKAIYEYELKKQRVYNYYERYNKFLFSIQDNYFFNSFLIDNTKVNKRNLQTLFLSLVKQDKNITQLRYINEYGKEIIRVDRKEIDGKVSIVEDKALQNKEHRDYFLKTIKKKEGELYISKLDLNIEHKKIETPYKPVWRFATPVFKNGKRSGIIVLNLFASYLLEEIKSSNFFEIDIFDQDDHILVSSNANEWTRYLNLESNLDKNKFIIQKVLIDDISDETLYIGITSTKLMNSFIDFIDEELLYLIILVMIVSFVLAKILSNIPKKLFDKLEKQQKIIVSQSKFAAMGEMTAMIAHQWRQPLNAVSVLVQELEIKYLLDKTDKDDIQRISNSINLKLEHMSKTIDGFRDFYKRKEKNERFNVIRTIEQSFDIVNMRLKALNIKKEISFYGSKKEEFVITANENELEQVFINLINNSIDAISERCDKNDSRYIKVFLTKEKKLIRINFIDSGKGIDENSIDKVFEPYYSNKIEKNGTGLGLYMSKTIIERNLNGEIYVENKDKGVCFTIILNI